MSLDKCYINVRLVSSLECFVNTYPIKSIIDQTCLVLFLVDLHDIYQSLKAFDINAYTCLVTGQLTNRALYFSMTVRPSVSITRATMSSMPRGIFSALEGESCLRFSRRWYDICTYRSDSSSSYDGGCKNFFGDSQPLAHASNRERQISRSIKTNDREGFFR